MSIKDLRREKKTIQEELHVIRNKLSPLRTQEHKLTTQLVKLATAIEALEDLCDHDWKDAKIGRIETYTCNICDANK